MNNYIVYSPNGEGCYLEIGTATDLQSAISLCAVRGKVEQTIEGGAVVVYTA